MKGKILSSQQVKFCEELANGKNQSEAYKSAYPKVKSDKAAKSNAYKLLTNAYIFNYYQSLLKKASEKLQITRESQLEDLQKAKKMALEIGQIKPFISAIAEQNKLLGLYEADKLDVSNKDGTLAPKEIIVNVVRTEHNRDTEIKPVKPEDSI